MQIKRAASGALSAYVRELLANKGKELGADLSVAWFVRLEVGA